jgi:hypothetical protein
MIKRLIILCLLCVSATGCIVHEHRDGGVTVRPM